jgi:hypothetical protein
MKLEKFKKAILGFSLVVVEFILAHFLLLFIALFSVVQAGNFTVTNVSQFQAALNTAAMNGENDTINVMAGTYNVNPTLTYSSNENYFILIRGVGSPVFDGGNSRRIMQLTSLSNNGDIFLEEITIQHGQADYGGGLNAMTQSANIFLSRWWCKFKFSNREYNNYKLYIQKKFISKCIGISLWYCRRVVCTNNGCRH